MPKPSRTPLDAFSVAIAMLARRPYSVAEIRRALERKLGAASGIEEAIARLRQLKYLDDKKFAEAYAASLVESRCFGRTRVRRELKAKLVDYRVIEPALDAAYQDAEETALLERVLSLKLRSLRLPLTRPRLHALCQSLLRHGFRADDIMKAVRARPELKPIAEDTDE